MSENTFNYTYSASHKKEIDKIRRKYAAASVPEEDGMQRLRTLDASVTRKACVTALTLGVASTLLMGLGMSLIMTDIAHFLGMTAAMGLGLASGVTGMCGVIACWPMYRYLVNKRRRRIAPEILCLIDQIEKDGK